MKRKEDNMEKTEKPYVIDMDAVLILCELAQLLLSEINNTGNEYTAFNNPMCFMEVVPKIKKDS